MSPALFAVAYALDWLIGDPAWLPHPVRWMGRMIQAGEWLAGRFARSAPAEFVSGALLTLAVVGTFGAGSWWLIFWLRNWHLPGSFLLALYFAAATLATRSLLDEARAVQSLLGQYDLVAARLQLARIVGRDTANLNQSEIIRAVIETVAESSSDGIVAPLFYLALGGPAAALAYKAINTLDSMIGHRGERYEYLGKFAARLDDLANFIPARLTALLLVAAAWTMHLDWRGAWRIMWLDGSRHVSPNAGLPEAAMAGALGVQLGGTNYYGGAPHYGAKLGKAQGSLDEVALRNALRLAAVISVLMFGLCLTALLLLSPGITESGAVAGG